MFRCAFTKLSAVWLAVLTLSPLTAPFQACDLASWLERSPHQERSAQQRIPSRAHASPSAEADAATAPLVSCAATARRVRLVAASPCTSLKCCAAPCSCLSACFFLDADPTLPPAASAILRI